MIANRIPDSLVLVSAQPHDPYFQWQIEVQIVNFRSHGVSHLMQVLVFYQGVLDKGWRKIEDKYKEVKFFYYPDEGIDVKLYIPILRPYILKKHFAAFPELSEKTIFYHDADIIFNYLPDFSVLAQGDNCYTSDTSSYLDYSYLRGKETQGGIEEDTVPKGLAELTGVSLEDIKRYDRSQQSGAGGAQYILKGIDSDFWKEVEEDCLKIRKFLMEDINKKYFPSEAAGFQSWCADMWAVNFNLWKRGKTTEITPLLDFSWATDHIDIYYKKPIFHNAGASSGSKNLFYKGAWINRSPIGLTHRVSQNFASAKYVEAINKVR
jgi:hypothetical protein